MADILTGGVEPGWRRDGKELFYLAADQQLMAVPVKPGGSFDRGAPKALFRTRADGTGGLGIVGRNQYAVTPDGRRFLLNQPPLDTPSPPHDRRAQLDRRARAIGKPLAIDGRL